MNHNQYILAVQDRMGERIGAGAFLPELLELPVVGMLSFLSIYWCFPKHDFFYDGRRDKIMLRPPDGVNLEAGLSYFRSRCLCLGDFASGGHAILQLDHGGVVEIWDMDRQGKFLVFEAFSLEEFVRKLDTPPLEVWLQIGQNRSNLEN